MNFFHQEIEEIKRTLQDIRNTTANVPNPTTPTHIPTFQHPLKAPKSQNTDISTGNEGVPTNQQTNQQTIQHPPISTDKFALNKKEDKIDQLQRASEILSSLDELKKEVRFKFKQLTNQEMTIYSKIYHLTDRGISVDYTLLAEQLGLSEVSIRDYIRKIINKGIPLDKHKINDQNNNKITLSIPPDLKKVASLNTIMQLREL